MTSEEVIEATLDGKPIRVLVRSHDLADGERAFAVSAKGGIPQLEDALETIRGVSSAIANAVRSIGPDKASVEFGFELAMEQGKLAALICGGKATGTIKITLEWAGK